jgi:hypothetical protein
VFRVHSSEFRVQGVGFMAKSVGSRAQGLRSWIL